MPMAASDYRALDPGEIPDASVTIRDLAPATATTMRQRVIAEFADREAWTLRLGRFPSPECRCP